MGYFYPCITSAREEKLSLPMEKLLVRAGELLLKGRERERGLGDCKR